MNARSSPTDQGDQPVGSYTRRYPCSCGGTYTEVWGDHALLVSMPVSRSSRCDTCGHSQEADGDTLPDSVRRAILQDGVWALTVPAALRARSAAAIRTELGLTFADIAPLLRTGAPLATGTYGEMTRLKLTLDQRGLGGGEVQRVVED